MQLKKDKEILIDDLEYADGILRKARGLMFRKLDEDEGLLMEFSRKARWSIWMFFVPQDLGLLFLDENKEVVDKKKAKKMSLNPETWKVYKPEKECKYVIECNPEKIEDIEKGGTLEW
ncbi:MAG: DUF192 domain-containing protein [Candidatus Aenigmatarchaeota archaeon]